MFGSTEKYQTKQGARWRAVWYNAKGEKQSKGGYEKRGDALAHLKDLSAGRKGGSNATIGALIKDFLAAKEELVAVGDLEQSTVDGYESRLRLYVQTDEIVKVKLGDLSRSTIRAFNRRLRQRVCIEYARKVKTTLSTMLEWAVAEEQLSHNMVRGVKFEGNSRPDAPDADAEFDDVEVKSLTIPAPDQARNIIASADRFDNTGRVGAQARLLFYGGLRPSEMLGFPTKMMKVLPDGRSTLKIVQRAERQYGTIGSVKTKASRREVTLGKEATRHIQAYMMATGIRDGLLFPTRKGKTKGSPERFNNFYAKVWAPVLADCGYCDERMVMRKSWRPRSEPPQMRPFKLLTPRFGPHDGRHFAVSGLIASGADYKDIQEFCGHTDIKTTINIYGHLFPNKKRGNALADALEGVLQGAG